MTKRVLQINRDVNLCFYMNNRDDTAMIVIIFSITFHSPRTVFNSDDYFRLFIIYFTNKTKFIAVYDKTINITPVS